jgi:hypothetical protein
MKRTILSFVLIATVIFLNCSDKSSEPNGQNPPAQQSIGPEGGIIQISGQASLTIPPGALTDTLLFTISTTNPPSPPGGTNRFVSNCIDIGPGGTVFLQSAALIVNYDSSRLGGAGESGIILCSYEDSGWEALSTVIDELDNCAVAAVDHLCDFVAMVDTGLSSQGCFASLVVGRTITVFEDILIRMDMSVARFDSAYAPCNPVTPLRPDSVRCNQFELTWDQASSMFKYFDIGNPEFIELGATYTFHIDGNTSVPDLTCAIEFPADDPYVTSPANLDTLSLSGFPVAWAGAGAGTVRFILMRDNDSTNVMLETENDGAYSFTGNQLSGLPEDDYGLLMIHQNSATINAPGYDSRSFIWGRVINTTVIYLR